MIHPSYVELMKVVNKDTEDLGEVPVINSRYSIVIASAKRARQLIDGAAPKIETSGNRKALSIAVDELYEQKVHILGEADELETVDMTAEMDADLDALMENDTDEKINIDEYAETKPLTGAEE